jgi:hypothetical protein
MKRLIGVAAVLIITFSYACKSFAQDDDDAYKFEVGAAIGMSGYLGDANTSNLFKYPQAAGSVLFRYFIDPRWAAKGTFTIAGLRGNSADMTNVFPGGETYKFHSTVYDLGGRIEYNFFDYGIGKAYRKLRRWTPYLGVGIGITLSSVSDETHMAVNIPMAVGVKYKLQPRINLALEWTMTKVFGDKVDGTVLDDPYHIKSSFVKNTDWYSTVMVTISYEFGVRCKSCFYVD